jgi:phosphohistidine phosphatase
MLLLILRHGKAEPGQAGVPDSSRRLTPDGKESLRRVLSRAAESGVKPETMLVSPYVRARETAEIAREVLGVSEQPLLCGTLTPDSNPESIWDEVRVHSQVSQLMLVGHNPLLSELLNLLIATGHPRDLRTASLACVEVGSALAQPSGRLLWLLTPEVCG